MGGLGGEAPVACVLRVAVRWPRRGPVGVLRGGALLITASPHTRRRRLTQELRGMESGPVGSHCYEAGIADCAMEGTAASAAHPPGGV